MTFKIIFNFTLLLPLLIINNCHGYKQNINDFADQLIARFNEKVTESGENVQLLPNIDEEFFDKLWKIFPYSGMLYCTGGFVGDLGSLIRTGDVNADSKDTNISIDARVGLASVQAGYKNCLIKFDNLNFVSGPLIINIPTDSIHFQATIYSLNKPCPTSLDSMKLDALSKITFDFGPGIMHKIEAGVLDSITFLFDWLIKIILNHVLETKTTNLPLFNLCYDI